MSRQGYLRCPHCNGEVQVFNHISLGLRPLTNIEKATILRHVRNGWSRVSKKALAARLKISTFQIGAVQAHMRRRHYRNFAK
jgi:hypothetical protein